MSFNERTTEADFLNLIAQLKASKPNDRSEQDRYWAITITEVEKAFAIFKTFAIKQPE